MNSDNNDRNIKYKFFNKSIHNLFKKKNFIPVVEVRKKNFTDEFIYLYFVTGESSF
jgi:hypothetical protein